MNKREKGIALQAIDDWKITAREEIETIGSYRRADAESRLWHPWGAFPKGLIGDTQTVVRLLVARQQDARPVQQVYGAISRFHKNPDRRDEGVSPQASLQTAWERAVLALNGVADELMSADEVKTEPAVVPPTNGKPAFPATSPDSPAVRELCHRLKKGLAEGYSQIVIAREVAGDDKAAESLLRQARRFRHLWQS
jgi:hypothetical protein